MGVVLVVCFCFFFFKQKTAYEMRISDWSSDVCSSDLDRPRDLEQLAVRLLMLGELALAEDCRFTRLLGIEVVVEQAAPPGFENRRRDMPRRHQIGRASCRERVCQYV